MSVRTIGVGDTTVDHFPAFEDDGFTKRTGLGAGDFAITVFRNAAELAMAVGIAEIGATGEYLVQFAPPLDGFYEVQILILFNKEIWAGEYVADSPGQRELIEDIKGQIDKIDLAPTLGPAEVVDGSLMDRMMNKDPNKTYNQATDCLESIRERMG